jgi:hypothetical protein
VRWSDTPDISERRARTYRDNGGGERAAIVVVVFTSMFMREIVQLLCQPRFPYKSPSSLNMRVGSAGRVCAVRSNEKLILTA